jgi:hypothetical protein
MAHMKRTAFALLFVAATAPACGQQTPPPPRPSAPPPGQVTCSVPRPQVCTREYRPVCGTRRDGVRQTYGNACSACADVRVMNHVPGSCS